MVVAATCLTCWLWHGSHSTPPLSKVCTAAVPRVCVARMGPAGDCMWSVWSQGCRAKWCIPVGGCAGAQRQAGVPVPCIAACLWLSIAQVKLHNIRMRRLDEDMDTSMYVSRHVWCVLLHNHSISITVSVLWLHTQGFDLLPKPVTYPNTCRTAACTRLCVPLHGEGATLSRCTRACCSRQLEACCVVECWLVVDSGLLGAKVEGGGGSGGTAAIVQLLPALPLLVACSCCCS